MALNTTQTTRTRFVAGGVVLAFVLVIGNLYRIQCAQHGKFSKLARNQHLTKMDIPVRRGRIFDRNGDPLATSLPVYSLYADPGLIEHKSPVAWKLAPILGTQPQHVFAKLIQPPRFVWIKRKLSRQEAESVKRMEIPGLGLRRDGDGLSLFADPPAVEQKSAVASRLAPVLSMKPEAVFQRLNARRRFMWIKRKLSSDEYEAVGNLKIKGLGFRREYQRMYPHGLLLGQTIGFCGIDDNGLAGIERACEQWLTGRPGYRMTRRDAAGTRIAESQLETKPASNGFDVTLTIDVNIQRIVEEELDEACEQWSPDHGVAIVMEPATGDILALANWPFFDPGSIDGLSAEEIRRLSHNTAVLDIYEPGSTFKPFIMCAALEEKLVTPHTVFDCENGRATLNGRSLKDDHPHGKLNATGIMTYSSNIGIGKIAMKLGEQRLHDYLRAFGFGSRTGLPVSSEPAGLLSPPTDAETGERLWSRYTITSIPMGQEVAVTPVQLAAGYSAIAAGGRLMRPRLISRVTDTDAGGIVHDLPPQVVRQVVNPATAGAVTEMLVNAVEDPKGTGRNAKLAGFRIAGKTGTAQKSLEGMRGYSAHAYVSSFIAYAPAYEPRVCVLVKIDTPRGRSHYGGTVAAPAVREIIRRTLAYMDVPARLARL